jgi:hypothetical protein
LEAIFVELEKRLRKSTVLHADRLKEINEKSGDVPQSFYDNLNFLVGELDACEELLNNKSQFKCRSDIDSFCKVKIEELEIQKRNQVNGNYDEFQDFDLLRGAQALYESVLEIKQD